MNESEQIIVWRTVDRKIGMEKIGSRVFWNYVDAYE